MPRRYRSDWRCEVAHARAVSIQETEYVIDIIKHVTVNFVCHIGLVFFFLYLSFLASASGQRAYWMYFVTMPLGISTWNVQSPTFKLFSRNILWAESRASFIILAIFVNCEIFPFIDKQTRLQPVIHIRAPVGCAYMLHRDRSRCGHQLNGSQRIEGAPCIHCQGRSRPGTN